MSSIDRLLEIMAQLRDPETGCPWDRKQTYQSIVPYTLEEAYEVADAIERHEYAELRDELGDLLFQVVFYSQIAREEGRFDFEQVVTAICNKMLRRHPHVFAGVDLSSDEDLHRAWESTKAEERLERKVEDSSALSGVTRALPALMRSHKLQKRAAAVGFDWPDVRGAFEKTREELAEVEEALAEGDPDHIEEELGDMLFAMVNIVRKLGFKAEHSMRRANDKFEKRFKCMEQLLANDGHTDLGSLDLQKMEDAWEAAKREEKK